MNPSETDNFQPTPEVLAPTHAIQKLVFADTVPKELGKQACLSDIEAKEMWRFEANCRGVDTNVLYPKANDAAGNKVAKKICELCPVREPCLDYAIENNQEHGVWGGVSEKERRRITRNRRHKANKDF